jgi:5'-3' exonuclease/transcription antitermination factor NusG
MVAREWVVFQLTSRGEDEDPDVLSAALKRMIKNAEVFVPASTSKVGESRVIHRLVDGYVFIRRAEIDQVYFRIENTRYIDYALTTTSSVAGRNVRKLATVPDGDVEKMRKQVHVETEQGINVGDEVQVTSGVYRGINASVIEDIPENDSVQVHVKLRSKEAIVTLPRSYLKFVSKGSGAAVPSFSPFATKIARIRDWAQSATPIIQWRPRQSFAPILTGCEALQRLTNWSKAMDKAFRLFSFYRNPPTMEPIEFALGKLFQIDEWYNTYLSLVLQVGLLKKSLADIDLVRRKFDELRRLDVISRRLSDIAREVGRVEQDLGSRAPDMIQNVIIDGHNLAYRVFYAFNAPTSKPMTDGKGRPTSVIYGVLKGIGALQKRFPEAHIYVCWDGSPSRRKQMFDGYKAGRPARALGGDSDFSQIDYLKQVLPLLGVTQVFNPEEETDDIVACLVKGRLRGQNNIMVSTDHDFLQLVTRTDILMVPKVGNRPEILYDPDKVVQEYGVEPQKVVYLRALMGSADTSDNLKGVPRVPTKVLAGLVNAHGSVDGVYSSGLAGVTPNQFEKIRAAEKQVKLNVQLMTWTLRFSSQNLTWKKLATSLRRLTSRRHRFWTSSFEL